ncbi:MAG: hypothetical protein WBP08_12980 [Saprospiraceae bacterium]
MIRLIVCYSIFFLSSCPLFSQYNKPVWHIKTEKDTLTKQIPDWNYTLSVGLNASFTDNRNLPGGTGDNGFSGTSAIDLYVAKPLGKFLSTNEFHYQVSFFKAGDHGSKVVKSFDNLFTLHDWSIRNSDESRWNLNFIAKISTPLIRSFEGGKLTSENSGTVYEKPGNPYDISFSPGFKCIINNKLKVSLSPYSFRFYGVTDQQIANAEIYNTGGLNETTGTYRKSITEKKGAELNIWFDWNIQERIVMEYRVDFSSKYSASIFKEGLFNGLFTTKVKLISNLYLTHRAILNGIVEQKPLKPELRQTVLLSYTMAL